MATDSEDTDVILEALAASDSVDARAVDIVMEEGGTVVVRGSVATFEEASAALRIAEEHADSVRNELRVEVNLREGSDGLTEEESSEELRRAGLQGSSYDTVEQPDDLVSDMQEALDESLPWDPPDEPVEVPTRAESRGPADPNAADDYDDEETY